MRRCAECGREIGAATRFCGWCGAIVVRAGGEDGQQAQPHRRRVRILPAIAVLAATVAFGAISSRTGRDGPAAVPGAVVVPSADGAAPVDAELARPPAVEPSLPPSPPRGPVPEGWELLEFGRASLHLPPAWDTIRWSSVRPRQIGLILATFPDDGALSEARGAVGTCLDLLPDPVLRAVGRRDVVVTFSTPVYARAFVPAPPPFGDLRIPPEEVEAVRSGSGGMCGNDGVSFTVEVARAGEWAYRVAFVIGRSAPDALVDEALAVVNSFRLG